MNKQIEEMAKYFCHPCDFECGGGCELGHKIGECPIANETAKILYNAGYRKQEDVARDIFTQLEKEILTSLESNYRFYEKYLNAQDSPTLLRVGGKIDALRGIYCFIEELKKRYGVKEDEIES